MAVADDEIAVGEFGQGCCPLEFDPGVRDFALDLPDDLVLSGHFHNAGPAAGRDQRIAIA